MKKTLLIIGDSMMSQNKHDLSLAKFISNAGRLNKRSISTIFITYDDLLHNRLPDVPSKTLCILMFFPYNYWNSHIEVYNRDSRIYGDLAFGRDFRNFFLAVNRILLKRYRLKNIDFVNPPLSCVSDRDKKVTHGLLKRNTIPTPRIFNIKKIEQAYNLIEKGVNLYIKPRFGAMGKGITYLSKRGGYTNFLFRNNKIVSRKYDYNWQQAKIPNAKKKTILQALIRKGFLFQEEVKTPLVRNRRFDLRVYVVYGRVPYYYAKSAPKKSFITNWSQGGRIEKKVFLKKALSPESIRKAKSLAIKAAKAMKLNYAGVDIIMDKNNGCLYVLEIQSFPGYERGHALMRVLADMI